MNIQKDIPLKNLTTMRLGGNTKYLIEAHSNQEIVDAYKFATEENLPVFVIGEGSNVIAHDEGFNGVIIKNCIPGFEITEENDESAVIQIGAGENWDYVVKRTVDMGLSGVEAMSWIPGTAGAAPVQNTGAYGQEISDVLFSVEAYDTKSDEFVSISKNNCEFSYRHSLFKDTESGRYIITSITIGLKKETPKPPFYDSIQKYFEENNLTSFTPQLIRDTVIMMRKEKLPNPAEKPNSGSFFHNVVVDEKQLQYLKQKFPDIPSYPSPENNFKIPTGWLIDRAGLKGKIFHGMKVHDKNALVLINESAQSYSDLAMAREEIIKTIQNTFGLTVDQEPLEI